MERERPYWNMEIESKLNTPEMKEIQLAKLKKQVTLAYENSSYWRRRFDQAGVKPKDINTLKDYSRFVPVFEKADFRRFFEECDKDMHKVVEGMMPVSFDKVVLMAATTGTTGEPTPYPLTEKDMELWPETVSRVAWRCGIRPADRIAFAFGLSMFLGGIPTIFGLMKIGSCVVPVGAEAGTDRILRNVNFFRCNVLMCTPSLADYIVEKAPEVIGNTVKSLNIKTILCGGEPGAGIPEIRKRIETAYGARLFDMGAAFGGSCDYPEYQGMHFVLDDRCYYELVDPRTKEPIPLEDGASGEAVFTTLDAEGFTWFRQSLGDVHQVFVNPCPCGRSGFRYKVTGRIDDMLKVKGVIVYPSSIDEVLSSFVPRITGEFRIVLDEPPPRVVPPLKLKIECGEGVKKEELKALAQEIEGAMHTTLKIRPQIQWLSPLTLERATHKTRFIEKTYEKKQK